MATKKLANLDKYEFTKYRNQLYSQFVAPHADIVRLEVRYELPDDIFSNDWLELYWFVTYFGRYTAALRDDSFLGRDIFDFLEVTHSQEIESIGALATSLDTSPEVVTTILLRQEYVITSYLLGARTLEKLAHYEYITGLKADAAIKYFATEYALTLPTKSEQVSQSKCADILRMLELYKRYSCVWSLFKH